MPDLLNARNRPPLDSERSLLRVVQYSPEAILLHEDGIVTYVNEAAVRMFRAESPFALVGRPLAELYHPSSLPALAARLETVRKTQERLDYFVHKMKRLDGETFDAEATSIRIGEKLGSSFIQTVLRDVTARLMYEEQLLDTSQRYERLVKFLPEPIVITDQGVVVYCNKSAARLFRVEYTDDIIGRSAYDFIHPDDIDDIRRDGEQVMLTDEPSPFVERRVVCADGAVTVAEVSSIRIHHYHGKSVILTVMRDLTERKQAEELLLQSEKLSVIGQLAAGVAHEIRNPLTALRGFTQLLRKELHPSKMYYLDTMLSELDRINYIVNDFMSLSKPHFVSYKENDIAEMLRAVLVLLESEAALYNVSVKWAASESLPRVVCDEHRIKQVFLNVLKNAIEAMPDGGFIHVHTMCDSEAETVRIRIRDEGGGMPAEIIQKAGEPFFTTKSNGTGLGLMICHRIVEAHGGTIEIHSVSGEGTTVEIGLPARAGGRRLGG